MTIATIIMLIAIGMILVDCCPIVTSINGSCCEVKSNQFKFSTALKSRVYNITKFCGDHEVAAEGYCDSATDGGGWLVIQRRQDGSVDFNRGWVEYEEGFGSLTGEFWYGLRPLHCLTTQGQWKLRMDFTFLNGTKSYLSYNNFAVGPANSQYQLSISGFTGITTANSFMKHPLNGMKFTTKDRDNDEGTKNCALNGKHDNNAGGWWYKYCSYLHPNHQYGNIHSIHLDNKWHFLPFIEMKIKPSKC